MDINRVRPREETVAQDFDEAELKEEIERIVRKVDEIMHRVEAVMPPKPQPAEQPPSPGE